MKDASTSECGEYGLITYVVGIGPGKYPPPCHDFGPTGLGLERIESYKMIRYVLDFQLGSPYAICSA
jgi:hypothetical protein